MARQDALVVRDLDGTDLPALRRLLQTSDYVYYRFTEGELPRLLERLPAAGAFSAPPGPLGRLGGLTLQSFLLVNALVPPSAWLGGFGVAWGEGARFVAHLDLLLPPVERAAAARGARTLYYSGNDLDADWLRGALEARGFGLITTLRSYDKSDRAIPDWGDRTVTVRPFVEADLPGVVAVEDAAFEPLWRHDADGFREVARSYPYFVVAEDEQGIAGYQYNALDGRLGYLVRIAVHPRVQGHGVGTRLMAEAVRYFTAQDALRILLNTEERNRRAHRLYERFGFYQVLPRGFVLARTIAADGHGAPG
jgi:ribosomal protein S18 acetylase RimI-like enzyme